MAESCVRRCGVFCVTLGCCTAIAIKHLYRNSRDWPERHVTVHIVTYVLLPFFFCFISHFNQTIQYPPHTACKRSYQQLVKRMMSICFTSLMHVLVRVDVRANSFVDRTMFDVHVHSILHDNCSNGRYRWMYYNGVRYMCALQFTQ